MNTVFNFNVADVYISMADYTRLWIGTENFETDKWVPQHPTSVWHDSCDMQALVELAAEVKGDRQHIFDSLLEVAVALGITINVDSPWSWGQDDRFSVRIDTTYEYEYNFSRIKTVYEIQVADSSFVYISRIPALCEEWNSKIVALADDDFPF